MSAFKQRALLAALLIEADRAVPAGRLIESIWRDRPPDDAGAALQVLVSQLRRALEPGRPRSSAGEVLLTRHGGYELRMGESGLDAREFGRLIAEGGRAIEAGDPVRALECHDGALALWRGDPFGDVGEQPFARAEVTRLEELRLTAMAGAVDARLRLGEHVALVGQLRSLVDHHPLQERFRAQLMLALYRSQRQADALDEYRSARRMMVEQLGIEPSPGLQRLHAAILNQDPALELDATDGPPAGVGRENRRPPPGPGVDPVARRGRRVTIAIVAVMLAVGGAVALLRPGGAAFERALVRPGGDGVDVLEPSGSRTLARIGVGRGATSVVVGAGSVWVLNADDRTVARIDPRTRRVVQTFATGETPTEIAVDDRQLWVGSGFRRGTTRTSNALTRGFARIDPETGRVLGNVALPMPAAPNPRPGREPGSVSAVAAFGALWAIAPDLSLVRVDARAYRPVARIHAPASAVAAAHGAVWTVDPYPGTLLRIDPATNAITRRIRLPTASTALAAGGGALWMPDRYSGTVYRIQPGRRPVVEPIAVGVGAAGIAADDLRVWVTNVLTDTVTVLDARNGMVRRVIPVRFPQNVAIGAGAVWVTTQTPGLRACGRLVYPGPGRPDRVIVSDLPLQLQGTDRAALQRAADAVAFEISRRHFRAGRFTVGYRSCDDSTAAASSWDISRCLGNAKGYAADPRVIGVIGTLYSDCTRVEIAVTNRTPQGPLPIVSGWNTYSSLTRLPPDGERILYPSGRRHYFRVVAQDHAQAAAGALLARRLGARRAFVLSTPIDYVATDLARSFPGPARRLGIDIVGQLPYGAATNLDALARRVRRARPDAVYIGARFNERGAELVRALRTALGRRTKLIVTDVFLGVPDLLAGAGRAAHGVYYTAAGLPDERLPPAGQRFLAAFNANRGPEPDAWPPASHGAAAAEALLDAIARSDGTRDSVVRALHATHNRHGILGPLAFDAHGDATSQPIGVWRVVGQRASNSTRAPVLAGAVLDRILWPRAALIGSPPGT